MYSGPKVIRNYQKVFKLYDILIVFPQFYFPNLVYIIGLHAVQFGNKWIRKIRGLPK